MGKSRAEKKPKGIPMKKADDVDEMRRALAAESELPELPEIIDNEKHRALKVREQSPFYFGFYAALGAMVASFIVGGVVLIALLVLGAISTGDL